METIPSLSSFSVPQQVFHWLSITMEPDAKSNILGMIGFPAAGLCPMSPWMGLCPRMCSKAKRWLSFDKKFLYEAILSFSMGKVLLFFCFLFFCKHIAKGKRIKWPYTSSTQGPWFQPLVHLLPLPHSAPLQYFLLLPKSRVWKNYRRQFTSFIPSERTPQTSTLNYYQKGSFGNSHFLKLLFMYNVSNVACLFLQGKNNKKNHTGSKFCFCKFPLI